MAKRAAVFAKFTVTSNRFGEFGGMIVAARRQALVSAGRKGAQEARDLYDSQRIYAANQSPSTLQTINYRTDGDHGFIIYVGTLRGAIFEFGASDREGRGTQPPRPFLQPATEHARQGVLPEMAATLPH